MSLRPDQKALMFFGTVAVLGAGVRVVRANGAPRVGQQPELQRQRQAADSSARAGRAPRSARGGGGRAAGPHRGVTPDSQRVGTGALDRRGYFNGKLDMDVATAQQMDALPGVSAAMARRIVLDRAMRGPFVTRDGLRRVVGVGPAFLARIDSLVTFTGTVVQPEPADPVIAPNRKVRVRRTKPPVAPRTAGPPRGPSRPEDEGGYWPSRE